MIVVLVLWNVLLTLWIIKTRSEARKAITLLAQGVNEAAGGRSVLKVTDPGTGRRTV